MAEQSLASDEVAKGALDAYLAGIGALDPTMIAAAFDESGELEDPVGSRVRRGRDEVAQYFADGLCSVALHVEIEVLFAHACGGSVAAHWHMRAVSNSGAMAKIDGIDVVKVSSEGLILRAKGYWDQSAFRKALSV
ncbi:MAG TPA: nuclear transport factor 2 family protein [Acidimicrobiales bacterium]|jgi:steroid delta-isomerase|nr:nuclear transport factor 2 family protein [Acidimicrobiales bacterium]